MLGFMDAITQDELVKPDIQAVLARTHLSLNLHDFLLPTFEAVSNAMHAIEAEYGEKAREIGAVRIHISHPNNPARFKITITDNGIGLNDENYRSFKTPFSGYKLKQHGRGFGRFIAFKVFGKSVYWSRYSFLAQRSTRSFQFDVSRDKEFVYLKEEPKFEHEGLQVEFSVPLVPWHDLIRELKIADVTDAIGSHFLPYFLYLWLPNITIQFDFAEPENITQHFKRVFVQSASGEIECDIEGNVEKLSYSITKIGKTRSFKSHCLLFSAADRIVGSPRDLTNKLGQPHFEDEAGNRYIVLAVVRGNVFETRLNDSRTGLNLSPKSVEDIVSSISNVVQTTERGQIEKIKLEQTTNLGEALRENPILRIGLKGRSVQEYVASKPNNWSAEEFVSDLAIERFRASTDLTKAIANAAGNSDTYRERIEELVTKLDANKKEALAEYVLHRKSVIELVEAARRFDVDGRRAPEDAIHELVFRRFNDSVDMTYFEHNLWLIDDALAFLPYISSDRTMHGGSRKKGDKVTDLAFFDDSIVLALQLPFCF